MRPKSTQTETEPKLDRNWTETGPKLNQNRTKIEPKIEIANRSNAADVAQRLDQLNANFQLGSFFITLLFFYNWKR